MDMYFGYGFDVSEINTVAQAELLRKLKPELHEETAAAVQRNEGLTEKDGERFWSEYAEYLDNYEVADAIAEAINNGERQNLAKYLKPGEKENLEDMEIVKTCNEFVYFDNLRFADDEPRGRYVTSASVFVDIVNRYVPSDLLVFGNIWCGSEYDEQEPYMS